MESAVLRKKSLSTFSPHVFFFFFSQSLTFNSGCLAIDSLLSVLKEYSNFRMSRMDVFYSGGIKVSISRISAASDIFEGAL